MSARNDVEELLSRTGLRLTASRAAIVDAVLSMDGPFSVSALGEAVARVAPGVGRASVFRTLSLLTDLSVVQRLHGAAGHERYVVCVGRQHHHHATCTACGKTVEFVLDAPSDLEAAIGAAVGALGFRPATHILEVLGLCSTCDAERRA